MGKDLAGAELHGEDERLIRRRHGFALSRGRGGDEARVVVRADSGASEAARGCLRRLVEAHRRAPHPLFAPVAEEALSDDPPTVSFAVDASIDGEELVRRLALGGHPLTYPQAAAFVRRLGRGLRVLHATDDGRGLPMVLDTASWGSFLFAEDGAFHHLGLGHDLAAFTVDGLPAAAPGVFRAPENISGATPRPAGDLYAIVGFYRSLLPYVELPPALRRAFRGEFDGGATRLVRWANRVILAAPPQLRPTTHLALTAFERAWQLLGVEPDAEGLRRRLAELVSAPSAAHQLWTGSEACWIELSGGGRTDLSRRGSLRRIVLALVEAHRRDEVLGVAELLRAGWPDEDPAYESGRNRVYVALSSLRKLGLEPVLERFDDGWRLSPSVEIRQVT